MNAQAPGHFPDSSAGHASNHISIFLDTVNVVTVKLCTLLIIVVQSNHYRLIPLTIIFDLFQGQNIIKQMQPKLVKVVYLD